MIKSIKHKGLKRFFETGNTRGIRSEHERRLRLRLATLNAAATLADISNAGNWDMHSLTGNLGGKYAIRVSGNWRLFFEFENGDVYLLDYDDYH